MGGCATKPKVLKDAAAAAGAPMPVPEKEEGAEDLAAVKGVGADDEANKRRSLSNLFKESEETCLEDGKDETYETKQASELSASNPKETEKPKCAEEQTPAPVVDDVPANIEAQKAQEVASTVEVPKLETSCDEKIEDIKTTTEGKKDETPEVRTEEQPTEDTQKPETPVEKKTEDTQHPEKKTEEAAPATPQIEDKKPPSTLEKTMEN